MVHKIQGKNIRQPIKHLNSTTGLISNPSEIANALASSISYNLTAVTILAHFRNLNRK